MTSLQKRLITVFGGVPVMMFIIFGLPYFGHLALAILACLFSIVGSKEMSTMIEKALGEKPNFPFYLGAFLPLSQWIEVVYPQFNGITNLVFIILILVSFAKEVFHGAHEQIPFEKSFSKLSYDALLVIYPNYLVSFIIKFNYLPNTSAYLALFFLLVFSNDIFAYVFGLLFGKGNRGLIKASPNKSIAGFIGGSLSSIAMGLVFYKFVPPISDSLSIVSIIIISFMISISADIGDLIESVMKRSINIKDSGKFTPGRGGALDNLDSLLTSAPLFYLLYNILGK